MIIDGLDRRLAPPTPADIAAIWLRLSTRQQDRVRAIAADRGLTTEQHIRARVEHVQEVLRRRRHALA